MAYWYDSKRQTFSFLLSKRLIWLFTHIPILFTYPQISNSEKKSNIYIYFFFFIYEDCFPTNMIKRNIQSRYFIHRNSHNLWSCLSKLLILRVIPIKVQANNTQVRIELCRDNIYWAYHLFFFTFNEREKNIRK